MVWLFFKLKEMGDCIEDLIDCDNKTIFWEQLFRLLVTEDTNDKPAIRVCTDGGGGGAVTLPIGNFVFVNPLGNDLTGVREDFHLPFQTLSSALNTAVSGDTIYVYGGTYNEANPLYKAGVNWHFIGQPILNLSAPVVWTDAPAGLSQDFINISGDAVVNHIGLGAVVDVTKTDTVVNINFKSVTSLAYATLRLSNGSGVINVSEKIECTLINHTIYLDGNSSYTINAEEVFNSASSGITSCVYVKNNANVYTGLTIINARLIQCDGLFSAVRLDYGGNTGKVKINVSDKIVWTNLLGGTYPQTNNTVINMGGNLVVNGDIDGGNGLAINMSTATYDKSVEHNGDAYNNGNLPLIGFGDFDIAFWLSNKATTKLNGSYTSSNDKVVTHKGTTSKIIINGEILSTYGGGGNNYGLYLESDANVTLLDNVKIVSDNSGTPFGIGAGGLRDIKIVHNVSSNVNTDANITNLITGTNYIFDTDIE